MRIGIAYLEYSRTKGIERISAELADRIAQRGHEVHFHCTGWENVGTTLVRFHKVRTLDFVNSAKLLSFSVAGKASLKRGHYDMTHSYGNLIGCDVITAQSCHRAGMDAAKTFRGEEMRREETSVLQMDSDYFLSTRTMVDGDIGKSSRALIL